MSVCRWCGKGIPRGRKFCSKEHRKVMEEELRWYNGWWKGDDEEDVPFFPKIRLFVVHATSANWAQVQPWNCGDVRLLGWQKRRFLHE